MDDGTVYFARAISYTHKMFMKLTIDIGRLWQGTFINVHKFMIMVDIFATGLVIFVDKLSYLKLTRMFATLHYLACLIFKISQVKEDR